jgi:class 3 adenylate cyclase
MNLSEVETHLGEFLEECRRMVLGVFDNRAPQRYSSICSAFQLALGMQPVALFRKTADDPSRIELIASFPNESPSFQTKPVGGLSLVTLPAGRVELQEGLIDDKTLSMTVVPLVDRNGDYIGEIRGYSTGDKPSGVQQKLAEVLAIQAVLVIKAVDSLIMAEYLSQPNETLKDEASALSECCERIRRLMRADGIYLFASEPSGEEHQLMLKAHSESVTKDSALIDAVQQYICQGLKGNGESSGVRTRGTVKLQGGKARRSAATVILPKEAIILKKERTDHRSTDNKDRSVNPTSVDAHVIELTDGDSDSLLVAIAPPGCRFAEFDVSLLLQLGRQLVAVLRRWKDDRLFQAIFENIINEALPHPETLQRLLDDALERYGLKNGLLYWAVPSQQSLNVCAYSGTETIPEFARFSYKLYEKSIATVVYNTNQSFFNTDASQVKNASEAGRAFFKIGRVPILAIPLGFSGHPLGAFVAWGEEVSLAKLEEIRGFGAIAAISVAVAERDRNRVMISRRVPDILKCLESEVSLETAIELILRTARDVGFKRARLFRVNHEGSGFELVDSLPKGDKQIRVPLTVLFEVNPYAKHTFEKARGNGLTHGTESRIYSPDEADTSTISFGPDPDAARLGKADKQPWGVVPLVIGENVVGQIVVDNEPNQMVDRSKVETLELLSGSTAVALLSWKSRHALSAEDQVRLVTRIERERDFGKRVEWALLFALRPEGLGASRAFFFEVADETCLNQKDPQSRSQTSNPGQDDLRFLVGFGGLGRNDVPKALKEVRRGSLADVFARAFPNEFRISNDTSDSADKIVLSRGTLDDVISDGGVKWYDVNSSDVANQIAETSDLEMEADFLAICVRTRQERHGSEAVLGLLIVDYSFQKRSTYQLRFDLDRGRSLAECIAESLSRSRDRYRYLEKHLNPETLTRLVQDSKCLLLDKFRTDQAAYVMSVDIRRSTEMMLQAAPQAKFAEFLQDLTDGLRQAVLNNCGVFEKFTGDGVLACFPEFLAAEQCVRAESHRDMDAHSVGGNAGIHALRAAEQCHEAFVRAMAKHLASFQVRFKDHGLGIGIDYGEISFRQIHEGLSIVGSPVVYACRLGGAPARSTYANVRAYVGLARILGDELVAVEQSLEIKHVGAVEVYAVSFRRHAKTNIPSHSPAPEKRSRQNGGTQ